MTHGFDAVSLDVGGVLVVPDHDLLAAALDAAGVVFDRARFGVGHYLAMAAVDAAASAHEDFPPDRILHVGDSVHYDVDGAAACGLQSAHMDPYEICASGEHLHGRTLNEVLALR